MGRFGLLPVKKCPAEHAFSAVSGKMKEEEKKKGPESYDDCTTRTRLRIRRKTLAQIL